MDAQGETVESRLGGRKGGRQTLEDVRQEHKLEKQEHEEQEAQQEQDNSMKSIPSSTKTTRGGDHAREKKIDEKKERRSSMSKTGADV
eukprot:768240-Hanusia_phi.AAC.4